MGTTIHESPERATPARAPSERATAASAPQSASRWPRSHVAVLLGLWLAIFAASLWSPPLLDDADSTHAQAAQAILRSGDWVTLHVDGLRYLEKAPLPYWIGAVSLLVFGRLGAAFALHLQLALTVLALALLGYAWSRRAFGPTGNSDSSPAGSHRAALYTGVFLLTSAGVFLFTRIFIPDALLSLLLALCLYTFLRALGNRPGKEDAVILSEASRSYREAQSKDPEGVDTTAKAGTFRPIDPPDPPGPPGPPGGPFMSSLIAHERGTDTLYAYTFWLSLALAVLTKGLVALVFVIPTTLLFLALTGQLSHWRRLRPFTGVLLFLAVAAPWHILAGLRNTGAESGHGFFWFYFINEHLLRFLGRRIPRDYNKLPALLYWLLHFIWLFPWAFFAPAAVLQGWLNRRALLDPTPAARTVLLLGIFSAIVLVFFSVSTNQEYYTFPAYLPLLMLLAAALATLPPTRYSRLPTAYSLVSLTFATLTTLGLIFALALGYGLWTSRQLAFVPDIGTLLAHRDVANNTLSMSHFFDLTGPSFAALRLPAVLAALAFALGPPIAWALYLRRGLPRAIAALALTSAIFLVAAHLAFVRFGPMLSSQDFALTVEGLQQDHRIGPSTQLLIYGDQAYGSSLLFYLDRTAYLVDGRSTSMLFGSTFPDAPPIFLTHEQMLAQWGRGPRKILFVAPDQRDLVDRLLGPHALVLAETSGKALLTDRPLDVPVPDPPH
jgi:4-amino-4-deoxy-L-arabinose transferase-like glycosyltransferase